MSMRKNFRQSNWLIELSPRKIVEPQIVALRSTFRGSTFFRLVEIRLYTGLLSRNYLLNFRATFSLTNNGISASSETSTDSKSALRIQHSIYMPLTQVLF